MLFSDLYITENFSGWGQFLKKLADKVFAN